MINKYNIDTKNYLKVMITTDKKAYAYMSSCYHYFLQTRFTFSSYIGYILIASQQLYSESLALYLVTWAVY